MAEADERAESIVEDAARAYCERLHPEDGPLGQFDECPGCGETYEDLIEARRA